jgi:hypothetical protein
VKLLYNYLKLTKISSFKNGEQEGKTDPGEGTGSSGWGKEVRKGSRRVNVVEFNVLMYENGKMRPVETIPGMRGEGIKKNDGRG